MIPFAAPLLVAFLAAFLAAGPGSSSGESAPGEPPVFPLDPVALVEGVERAGREDVSVVRGGFRYVFADASSRRRFEADPGRYEIQLGGACARMGPLSGMGSTEIHAVHDGRIYLFASEACRAGFLEAPERLLGTDDAVPATDPEAERRGRELLARALEGVGGTPAVDRVASYREAVQREVEHDGQELESLRARELVFGVGARVVTRWGDYRRESVVTADDAFFAQDGDVRPMVASQRRELERGLHRLPLAILRARSRPDFVAVAAGPVDANGTAGEGTVGEALRVAFDGATTTLVIDPESGRIVRATFRGRGPSAAFGTLERRYRDFRRVRDLVLPHGYDAFYEGAPAPSLSTTFTHVEVDSALAPLERPAR